MTLAYTFLILAGFWILLSGKFDLFHLSLGFLCCLLVSFLSHDLLFRKTDKARKPIIPPRFMLYLPWLLYQIVVANFQVARLALSPKLKERIGPRVIRFNSRLKGEMAQVTFANSITLTPGTITVRITNDEFVVHALSRELAAGLPGDMETRIARVFDEEP
ncbi:MAG: Na+/H+ antiporter subunit E [Planctomycetes bacterium]|nr:Na+/H+ antiporter subunit E [Planctomycetota bacterium]